MTHAAVTLSAGIVSAVFATLCHSASVSFANEGATVEVPAGYTHELEDGGKTIVIRPPTRELFEFRLTFHSLAQYTKNRPKVADEFVTDTATKKGRRLLKLKGNDSLGFLEPGAASLVNGEPARNMHGIVAIGQGYVTLTLTVPEKNAQEPTVREFVGGGMEALLGTLRVGKA